MIPCLVELCLAYAHASRITIQGVASILVGLGALQQPAVVGEEIGAVRLGVVRMQLANMDIAGQPARELKKAMPFLHGASWVGDQDTQLVARVCEQKASAGLLNAAVMIEPGLRSVL